ncbi:hypothetical protein BDV41DRAFT_568639 [Aspergillus transmontanensis]|uniref:Sugar phosphate phosphatase n=1 Tax=Aspergillus transmontanensis TaxID=1034304 RepID=A0A5N6VHH3_9EURO|nr:hypothetical protein BDV41DRAFT_568639 [Aspergillus transmontanensis]
MNNSPRQPIAGHDASNELSFAYVSAHDWWSVILAGAIADSEGDKIIEGLRALRSEIQSDAKLTPLPDNGFHDIVGYNEELAQRDATWMNISTFKCSKPAVLELAARYKAIQNDPAIESIASERHIFQEMCEICLWGNATDLSLTSLTYGDIQKLQGSEAGKMQEKNVLVKDIPDAYDVLKNTRQERNDEEIRVDIVLDNAGFELYVDLLLAGYLLSTGLATKVVLRPILMPWLVSDVLPVDFTNLLLALSDPENFFGTADSDGNLPPQGTLSDEERGNLTFLFDQLNGFSKLGRLAMHLDPFWTTGGSYWSLPHVTPSLFEELERSELVLFKGDLNYRKLTGDCQWETTTLFSTAIGRLDKVSGIRSLALRTCKADVVVGLPEGEDQRFRQTHQDGQDIGSRK